MKLMDSMKDGQGEGNEEAGSVGAETPPKQDDSQGDEEKEVGSVEEEEGGASSGIHLSATIGMVNLLLHSSSRKLASISVQGTIHCLVTR